MAASSVGSELTTHVTDMLEPLGAIAAKRFFGGIGIFHDAILFAMIMDETLYFRVSAESRRHYEAAGSQPFSYDTRKGSKAIEGFYTVPEDLLDEAEALREWARTAIAVAIAVKAKKRPVQQKR